MRTIGNKLTSGKFITLLFIVGSLNAEVAGNSASSYENSGTALQLEEWMMDEITIKIK